MKEMTEEEWIALARDDYESSDGDIEVEVDADAAEVSVAEDQSGAWVKAWLWCPWPEE